MPPKKHWVLLRQLCTSLQLPLIAGTSCRGRLRPALKGCKSVAYGSPCAASFLLCVWAFLVLKCSVIRLGKWGVHWFVCPVWLSW